MREVEVSDVVEERVLEDLGLLKVVSVTIGIRKSQRVH